MNQQLFTPEDRLIDIWQCLEMVPVSKTTWWKGAKEGVYPSPVKVGGRTFWRYSEVLAFVREEWEPSSHYVIPVIDFDPNTIGFIGLVG